MHCKLILYIYIFFAPCLLYITHACSLKLILYMTHVIVGKYIIFKAHSLLTLSFTMCTSWYFPLYATPNSDRTLMVM